MRDPWALYDALIGGIPPEPTVEFYQSGPFWTRVRSSEDSIGLAMTYPVNSRPPLFCGDLTGRSLRETAELVKSWNFLEAAIGLAAINSWYNCPQRAEQWGFLHRDQTARRREAFDVYAQDITGKKVAIVGHFPFIEKRLAGQCTLSVLERDLDVGDYPDPACEYLLPEQDYVFITASALVNKTMPRLLELSQRARTVLVGPSTPLAPLFFARGVYGLSGMVVTDNQKLELALQGANTMALFQAGLMVDQICGE